MVDESKYEISCAEIIHKMTEMTLHNGVVRNIEDKKQTSRSSFCENFDKHRYVKVFIENSVRSCDKNILLKFRNNLKQGMYCKCF